MSPGCSAPTGRASPKRPKCRSICHAIRSEIWISAVSSASPNCHTARLAYARGTALEVVLGLRRVRDLALDARQPEDPQRVALVRVAEEVELAALEEQVVRVAVARARRVAGHRVVVEGDRLVAEDRRLDLREALREVVPAGGCRDPERHAALLRRAQRVRAPP